MRSVARRSIATLSGVLVCAACLSNAPPDKLDTSASAGASVGGASVTAEGGGAGTSLGGSITAGSSGNASAGTLSDAGTSSGGKPSTPPQGGQSGTTNDTGGNGGEPPIVIDPSKRQLVSVDGFVKGSTNGFGIEGQWVSYGAPTAQVTPNFSGLQVCVKGNYPRVPDSSQWAAYWGGGIALILRQDGKGGSRVYDAEQHQFAGLEMTISGSEIPHELRLKFKESGSVDNYCTAFKNVKSGDRVRLMVADVTKDCWNAGGAHVNAKNLEHFQLQVFPELGADIKMDLCLTDINVVPSDLGGGGNSGAGGDGGASGLGGAAGAN